MRARTGVLSFSLVACTAMLAWTYAGAAQTATSASGRGTTTAKSAPANLHWVETWGTAETPARGAPPSAAAGRGPQPVPPPAALQNRLATPIPIAPEMAPAANTAAGGSTPQRRYNLPRAESKFDNQTVRMSFRVSMGGSTIRVRLYNAFGSQAVRIGAAHVALHARASGIVPGSDRALTFGGKPTATMYAGQTLVSDPAKLTVSPLGELAVSLYFPQETGAPTYHPLGLQPTYTSAAGDFTSAAEITDPTSVTEAYYYIEGVDVAAPTDAAAIVTFGDSITDGDQSTPSANAMWPAILAERLQANAATRNVAVVNEGISGNRILGDNVSGLSRFRLQALDVPGVKWVTVLEGINDINAAIRAKAAAEEGRGAELASFSAEDLIAAYHQMIEEAHTRGIKVIGCTLTPYGESSGYKDAGEAIREAANNWIRTSGEFDAVVDFDKATRDATNPKDFSASADSPDMLHPGDAGYKMMADAFKLAMFAPTTKARQ
ncbi:MAG: SGNH/GDSL hydrolase family protein [Candidatus Acidiferrales bacterium]